jgi:hypothetical protein
METGKKKGHHPVWMDDAYQPMELLICTIGKSESIGFLIAFL